MKGLLRTIGVLLPLSPFLLYLAYGLFSPYLGYWHNQAFVFGSAFLGVALTLVMRESWPVAHPWVSFLFVIPSILIVMRMLRSGIQTGAPLYTLDWGQWLGSAVGVALLVTVVLVAIFRDSIPSRWAVIGTGAVVLVYSGWTLATLNQNLNRAGIQLPVSVVSINPGMVRSQQSSITIEAVGPYSARSEHVVTGETFRAADDGIPLCLNSFSGGLGWRWTALTPCRGPTSAH